MSVQITLYGEKIPDKLLEEDESFTIIPLTTCKYCGEEFIRTQNPQKYCSKECFTWGRREQKAKYQRKRRMLINKGVLISNENNKLGTNYLSSHRHKNFIEEYQAIQKEKRRIGV